MRLYPIDKSLMFTKRKKDVMLEYSFSTRHVTDFPVVNVHVDELSSARIWQNKLCATLSANVNINNSDRLPIKVYYRICTLRHIRIEINHGSCANEIIPNR
jgi:hypothetical protein